MILKKFYLCAFFVLFAFSYFYGLNKDFWRFFFFCVQDFMLFLLLYCKIKTKAYLILIIIASENNYYYLGKGYAHVAISNARYKRPLWSLCGSYKINALINAWNTMYIKLIFFFFFNLNFSNSHWSYFGKHRNPHDHCKFTSLSLFLSLPQSQSRWSCRQCSSRAVGTSFSPGWRCERSRERRAAYGTAAAASNVRTETQTLADRDASYSTSPPTETRSHTHQDHFNHSTYHFKQ